MSRKIFTKEQQQLLQQNPYIYSVTDTRITLTKVFKEIFMTSYNTGQEQSLKIMASIFPLSVIVAFGAFLSVFARSTKSMTNFTKAILLAES